MLAIVLGLCTAWLGIEPSLNQPRPQAAQRVMNIVVPVAYWDEEVPTFIPPAPLPEFSVDEGPQIRFEFSRIESCSDSDDHPPAPPAELDCVIRRGIDLDFNCCDDVTCDAECETEAAYSPACEASYERPTTVQQLHHLRTAIEHLNAAGMPELTNQLREQYRESVARLREKIQQELEANESEVIRLQQEIQLLKSELNGVNSLKNADDQDQAAACQRTPMVVILNDETLQGLIEPTETPGPTPQEPRNSPDFLINPAFYAGGAPQHIQEKWDRAMHGALPKRITSTESPQWVSPPAAPPPMKFRGQGQKFHILRFVPDESFPKLMIEPPAHLDDSGILLPAPAAKQEDIQTVSPTLRLHLRRQAPVKRTPKSDAAATLEVLPPAPVPEEERSTKDDPET